MEFEYNGNLLEEDRIDLVSKEIIDKYPMISIEKAKEAAMLERKISTQKNMLDELNRLYNIMLTNSESKVIVSLVYKDFLKVINDNNAQSTIYYSMIEQINDYIMGYSEFPIISDYQ